MASPSPEVSTTGPQRALATYASSTWIEPASAANMSAAASPDDGADVCAYCHSAASVRFGGSWVESETRAG